MRIESKKKKREVGEKYEKLLQKSCIFVATNTLVGEIAKVLYQGCTKSRCTKIKFGEEKQMQVW